MRTLGGLLVLALLFAVGPLRAEERILDYGSELVVRADGTLEVTETIRVRAEGVQIRRGLFRDFPTRYRDRVGNRVRVGFELLGVERNGRPEPYFTEQLPDGVRINTGDDAFLPVPAEHAFTIRYRTTRQLGFFPDHDELYFNTTGLGWAFPIDHAWARVELPADLARSDWRLDGYTGPAGAKGRDWRATVEGPRTVRFETTRPLAVGEGLTIAVGFPKGLVTAPTQSDRARWFFRDNAGVLVGVVALCALLAYYGWRWHHVGRDPPAGPVFPRYEPPAALSPGEVRMLRRMGYDTRAFAADVVAMAVHGVLDIHEDGGEWRLTRRRGEAGALSPGQAAIATRLFAGGDEVVLENTNASVVGGARSAQQAALAKRLVPALYVTNGASLLAGVAFSAVAGVGAFAVSGGHGLPLLVGLGLLAVLAHALFTQLLKAPTPEGRRRLDEIAGFRMYLSVAERDEIRAMALPGAADAPPLDAARYEALLPYAMALDVESKWTDKFTAAVGVEEAQRTMPRWYHGGTGTMGLASLGSSLGSSLTQTIASASTPPGSSSGGGGGGFSGGGGGGGGGGGR